MSTNEIPPITDPMGQHWQQPAREDILLDDTHALMTPATFERLADYSFSQPSGVYAGKMWKASDRTKRHWWLRWFGLSDDPGFVTNHVRIILLT